MKKKIIFGLSLLLAATAFAAKVTDNTLKLGGGTATNQLIEFNQGLGSANPKIKANNATNKIQFAHDGVTYSDLGSGNVSGPGSSTDNALVRFDGTTGALLQNSSALLSDLGGLSGLTSLDVDNLNLDLNTLSSTNTNGNINLTPNGTGSVVLKGLTFPNADSTSGYVISTNGSGTLSFVKRGDLDGPASSSDNAITRFDGTTGKLVQNSSVLISDTGVVSGATQIDAGNLSAASNTLSSTNTNGNINLTPNGTGSVVLKGLTFPNADSTSGYVISTNGSGTLSFVKRGDLDGPASSTDNAITRFDGTTGKLVQNSSVSISDTGDIAGALTASIGNLNLATNTLSSTNSNGNINLSPNGTGKVVISGLRYPTADGSADQVLKTDGAGNLSFTSVTGGGGTNAAPYTIENLGLAISYGAGAMTITLKQKDGTTDPDGVNPVKIGFASNSATTGAVNIRSVTSALTITVPSGAELGRISGVKGTTYIYAIDNAGTVELAVSYNGHWDQGDVVSTTLLNTASDPRNVMYSTTARSNVPVRLIGLLSSTVTTAGTWASAAGDRLTVLPAVNPWATAKYSHTLGSTINTATETIVNYNNKIEDSHDAVTTGGSWVWTAPFKCHIFVDGGVGLASTSGWAETEYLQAQIHVNGSSVFATRSTGFTGTDLRFHSYAWNQMLNAGDTVQIRVYQDNGANIALSTSGGFMNVNIKAVRIYEQ